MQIFQAADQFDSNWQFYMENEVKQLANNDDFTIDHYSDSEIFNPDVRAFLLQYGSMVSDVRTNEQLALGHRERRQLARIDTQIQLRFKQFKTWLKQVICELLNTIDWENTSTKEIIGLIIVALIPYFAGAGGLPALLLPIIIVVFAKIIKRGIEAVCPI